MKKTKLPAKIKMPPIIKTFTSKDADISPFEMLYGYVASKLGGIPKGKRINVSDVRISLKDEVKLNEVVKKWIKKYHKPYADDKFLKECVSYHSLEIGPAIVEDIESGYIYVTENVFE